MYVCILQSNTLPTELSIFVMFSIFLSQMKQLEQCVHLLLYLSIGKWEKLILALIEIEICKVWFKMHSYVCIYAYVCICVFMYKYLYVCMYIMQSKNLPTELKTEIRFPFTNQTIGAMRWSSFVFVNRKMEIHQTSSHRNKLN